MKAEKVKEKYCSKCQERLDDDWMFDECDECILDRQRKITIIKGAVIGGAVLALGSIAGVLFYKNKKKK